MPRQALIIMRLNGMLVLIECAGLNSGTRTQERSLKPNTMPTISVVITTHNRAHLLSRAIESAQAAGSVLEVIVVDDASTDGTPELCARLAGIRYVCLSSNRGLAQARNVGIAESSSEFITFLDDDDLRLPGSLDAQLRVLDGHGDSFPLARSIRSRALKETSSESGSDFDTYIP